jgi:D-tyrosyl-tRNA(Tyr) deacylase
MASVSIEGETVATIGNGMLVLVGVGGEDTDDDVRTMVDKLYPLRIFNDAAGRMNLAASDTGAEFLVVSQFTLFADTSRGRRPSFVAAAAPEQGERLYELFVERLRAKSPRVETGRFGAHMMVSLTNDGPVTIIMDSR